MTPEVDRVSERLDQTERDLREIDEQVAAGELDVETADRLRERYEEERTSLLSGSAEYSDGDSGPGVLTGSRLLGIGAVLIAVIGLGLWLIMTNSSSDAGVEGLASDGGVNLDEISNEQMEQVVAQNPDISGMRLALADRYFAEGDFTNALTHYLYVLQTLEIKDPAALANVGWMTYLSGVPDTAAAFVEESLEVQPDGGIAFWYLANIRFFGLNDAAGAAEPLQQLLEYDNLPAELRAEAESLLADVEASL